MLRAQKPCIAVPLRGLGRNGRPENSRNHYTLARKGGVSRGLSAVACSILSDCMAPDWRTFWTWVTAAPPQDLVQEGGLVSGGQWDLPVTELLSQAALESRRKNICSC